MTITAKFSSFCPKCRTQIDAGSKVEWTPGSKATHVVCPLVVTKGECLHPVFHKQGCQCAATSRQRTQAILEVALTDDDDRAYDAFVAFLAEPQRIAVEDAGVYVMPDNSIVKVKANREKTRTYAMRWIEITGVRMTEDENRKHGEYQYEAGLIDQVARTGRKMTLEEAKAFIVRYGQCCRCGRHLKDATSVERGIGPVCIRYFAAGTTAADLMVAA